MVEIRFEARPRASRTWSVLSPLIALLLTTALGVALFVALNVDPWRALSMFYVEPFRSLHGVSELVVKAAPLTMIALGLSLSYRANVWNIGAEGQYVLGAICASGVALRAHEDTSGAYVLLVLVAGALGGMAWAGVVAFLRDRYHANEILVSLMLVYVAELLLGYLVFGPWKDPQGYNFPQTVGFVDAARLSPLVSGSRVNAGAPLALLLGGACWFFMFHTLAGFRVQVVGQAPRAALYAGFSARATGWLVLLAAGGLAGLAGAFEVAGPLGQLTPYVPVGYGFSAIIVAFVGRLHPFGVVCAALLMSALYIGGELAQSRLGLPKAISSVFQGVLLFTLLACETLVQRRLRVTRRPRPAPSMHLEPASAREGTA